MAGLNVNMTDDLREFVDGRTEEKGFSTPTEYVRQLIREDRERATQEQLEELLVQGLQSGDPVEMTPEDWSEIRRTARERLAAKKAARDQ